MLLYKYTTINKYSLESLARNRIWFSNVRDFNDPFEGKIHPFYYDDEDVLKDAHWQSQLSYPQWSNEVRRRLQSLTKDPKDKILLTTLTEAIDKADSAYKERKLKWEPAKVKAIVMRSLKEFAEMANEYAKESIELMHKKCSVFCLTERNNDMLMWSYYANSHRGFCLEFDTLKAPKIFQSLRPIVYTERYPVVKFPRELSEYDAIFAEILTDAIFFTKALKWSHEKEWRIIRNRPAGLNRIPANAITGVILGVNMTAKDKLMLMEVLEKKRIRILRARLRRLEFALDIVPEED